MSQIVRNTEETGARARENRRWAQGRVVAVYTDSNTARIDVGAATPDGSPVYLESVPYPPISPPSVGSIVSLEYFGTSNHNVRIVGGGVGGQNAVGSQQINASNVVNTIRKDGETSGQSGDIILAPGANMSLTRSGKTFTFASGGASIPSPIHPGNILVADDGLNWVPATLIIDENGAIVVDEHGNAVWGEP